MPANDLSVVEASETAEAEWTEHVEVAAQKMLLSKTNSWFLGYNPNLPGRQKRTVMVYAGGSPAYREQCEASANDGYAGFNLS